jgi:hypothetical protein
MGLAELPDIYETNQGRALGAALKRARGNGDLEPALKIARHLVAESSTPAEVIVGMILFKLSVDALETGNEEESGGYMRMMAESCGPDVMKTVLAGSLLHVGQPTPCWA